MRPGWRLLAKVRSSGAGPQPFVPISLPLFVGRGPVSMKGHSCARLTLYGPVSYHIAVGVTGRESLFGKAPLWVCFISYLVGVRQDSFALLPEAGGDRLQGELYGRCPIDGKLPDGQRPGCTEEAVVRVEAVSRVVDDESGCRAADRCCIPSLRRLRIPEEDQVELTRIDEQIKALEGNAQTGAVKLNDLEGKISETRQEVGSTKAEVLQKTAQQIQSETSRTKTELSQAIASKADASQVQAMKKESDAKIGQVSSEVGGVRSRSRSRQGRSGRHQARSRRNPAPAGRCEGDSDGRGCKERIRARHPPAERRAGLFRIRNPEEKPDHQGGRHPADPHKDGPEEGQVLSAE